MRTICIPTQPDNGYYAATQAAKRAAQIKIASNGQVSALDKVLAGNSPLITVEEDDMNALNRDSPCDDDKNWSAAKVAAGNCTIAGANVAKGTQLFLMADQVALAAAAAAMSAASTPAAASWAHLATAALVGAAAVFL
jgi:hypothetical protein